MKLSNILHPSRTIAGRLSLRVILTTFLVFATISLLIFGFAWIVIFALMGETYQCMLTTSNERANSVLTAVEVAIANSVAEVEIDLNNPDKMYSVTERILTLNPNIVGSAIAFEPYYYPQKGEQFSPYSYRKGNEIKTKQLGNKDYEYHYMDWYQIPKLLGKPYWSEPYYDEGGGEIPMTTYSLPLFNSKGEMYAVLTADISLDWIYEMVHKMDSLNNNNSMIFNDRGNTFSFIIGRGGTYIVHPDKKRILNETIFSYYKEREREKEDSIAHEMIEGKEGWSRFTDGDKAYFLFYAPIKRTGWSMAIAVPRNELFESATDIGFVILFLLGIGLIIVFFDCTYGIRRITKPLTRFAHSADEIAQGHFDAELPTINSQDEMLTLRNSFETMQKSLTKQIEETKRVNEQKGRIESELYIARDIQMSMLPKTFPPFPNRNDIDIYGQLQPAKEVGGDLYDFHIRDEKLFFCIGDVSGKGVPASLVMAVTRAQFRTISSHESMPNHIVSAINNTMAENNESNMFVTLFVGVLDLPSGRMRYTNAGHDSPLLINGNGSSIGMLPVDPNLPAGVISDWKFTTQETIIDPGTTIFLYTDGLTEAENIKHEQFGEDRIRKTAISTTPQALIERMTSAVKDFVGKAQQSDDLTMMAIQYTKQQLDEHMQRSITLTNNLDEIPQLASFVEEVCETLGFDMSTTMNMNLAIEEAVVNVIDYAYPNDTKGIINIEAKANDQRLKFIISDSGIPFDPTAKAEVDTTLSVEERPIGGLGIHLVRQIMDSINYERVDGKNVLTLRKTLQAKGI